MTRWPSGCPNWPGLSSSARPPVRSPTWYPRSAPSPRSTLFLEGQGWGFGGSVDIAVIDPWNVPGRYGWVGGTGTSAHITPSAGTVAILLAQVAADSPVPPEWMRDFWQYAANAS